MFVRISIVAGALVLSTAAIAQHAPTASPTPVPAADKKFCRREIPLGSMMPGKPVCRTKAEWAAIDGANSENAQATLSQRNNRLNAR